MKQCSGSEHKDDTFHNTQEAKHEKTANKLKFGFIMRANFYQFSTKLCNQLEGNANYCA